MLLLAVKTAKEIPDAALLPALMEHALKSQHQNVRRVTEGRHYEMIYDSVLSATAEALYKATDGKVGVEKFRRANWTPSDKSRKEMVAKWEKWWEANKPKEKATPKPEK